MPGWLLQLKDYISIKKRKHICVMLLLTLAIDLTWICSLLYWRSCSPRITRWFPGLERIKTDRGVIIEMAMLGCFSRGYRILSKLLTKRGNEQQWQPSIGWSGILHRSGIPYHPKSEKMHIYDLFWMAFFHLNYIRGCDCSKGAVLRLPEEKPARARTQTQRSAHLQSCCIRLLGAW